MTETILLESYLLNQAEPADKLLMNARMLLDAGLRDKAEWQQQTYALVQTYSRNCLKLEIAAAQKKVFTEKRFTGFRKKISDIFK